MTLISQNMASSKSNASAAVTTSGKVSTENSVHASEGSTPVLELSFSQLLGGEGETTKPLISLSDAATLLQGLLQNTSLQEKPVTEADPLSQLLQGLNEEMTKLDEVITENPELMAVLQDWLQQVNTLLSTNEMGSQTVDVEESSGISKLAEQPATIRFALQDGLGQLATLLQNKEVATNISAQAVQLLASFENLLQAAGVIDIQKSQGTVRTNNTHAEKSPLAENVSVNRLPDNQGASVENRKVVLSNLNVASLSNAVHGDAALKTVQETLVTQSNLVPVLSVEEDASVNEVDTISSNEGTFTAGELAMREGIKNPLKAAPPIPVEQFAKEMTNFVVNKFDIVQQNGMTEAKISLYPEHLGQVDIKITMLNGQLVASFMTEHAGAKELIEQQMSQLRLALQAQGLQVERLEVTQNQSLQSQMYQDGRQSSAGKQQSNQKSKEREGQSDDSLLVAELSEEWNARLTAQVDMDKGSTFVAKV